jgi:hypothetical protein
MIVIESLRLHLSQFQMVDAPEVFACITPAIGGWPSFDFFYPSTTSAAPAFVLFESWEPLTYPSGDVPRLLPGSVGREKIGGANASGAQLSHGRKAGPASVGMVTAKLGQL